jgi:hypothetical protein
MAAAGDEARFPMEKWSLQRSRLQSISDESDPLALFLEESLRGGNPRG